MTRDEICTTWTISLTRTERESLRGERETWALTIISAGSVVTHRAETRAQAIRAARQFLDSLVLEEKHG